MANAVRELDIVTRLKGDATEKAKILKNEITDLENTLTKLKATWGDQVLQIPKVASEMSKLQTELTTKKTALEGLNTQVIQTGSSMNSFSKRDLGLLTTQMLTSVNVTGKLGSQLSNLAQGLLTGGYIGAGFAAIAALVNAFTEALTDANEEAKELERNMEPLAQKFTRFMNFQGKPGGLISSIQGQLSGLYSGIQSGQEAGVVERLRVQVANYTELRDLWAQGTEQFKLYDSWVKQVQSQLDKYFPKQEKQIRNQKSFNEALRETLMLIGQDNSKRKLSPKTDLKSITGGLMSEVSVKEVDDPYNLKDVLKEQEKNFNDFISNTANVFRSEFGTAWQDIFGEANSLFEKLMASWAEMLLMKVGTGLLTSFFGGIPIIGDLFGFSRSVNGGAGMASRYGMGN